MASRETKKDLLEKIEQLTSALQRERADAANHQRQFQLKQLKLADSISLDVISRMLPLLDNLERAFGAAPAELQDNNWVKGVLYIESQLKDHFKVLDLTVIETLGQAFDPQTMEAVETIEDQSQASGTVASEVLKGYFYKDQVLRPAQVKVVKNDESKA